LQGGYHARNEGLPSAEFTVNDIFSGRAFLLPNSERPHYGLYVYERGIFIGLHHLGTAQGIIEGVTTNAARDRILPIDILKDSY
jgi:hypothetical protein